MTISLSGKRKAQIFKVIAIGLPFLLIILLEISLRVFGYGTDLRLFKLDNTEKFCFLNPEIGKKYFTNTINFTNGNMDFFPVKKSSATFRIFVLGSSTSLGFPYMYNGAFPRMLKYRLQRLYPEKNIEIINLSLTAINSFAVRDMAKDVVNYQPDAVLIYTGQNEYHGTLGVASSGSFAGSQAMISFFIWSKKSRLMQLIYNTLYNRKKTDASSDLNRTLMERMALNQKVEFGSKKYNRGIDQYKANITATLEIFHKKNVPVFIGTLFTNLKDLFPFQSGNQTTDVKKFNTLLRQGTDALENDTATAYKLFLNAYKLDTTHAGVCFRLGKLLYANGDYTTAYTFFLKAKEYDQLRFRAPEAFNVFVGGLSRQFSNVTLVDLTSAFRENSPHGIMGSELLLEHVHPNLVGYGIMADAYLNALQKPGLLPGKSINNEPLDLIRSQMPLTAFDTIYGYISNILLKENWPFNEPLPKPTEAEKTFEGKVAGGLAVKQFSWKEAMMKLLDYYREKNDIKRALALSEGLCLEYPYEAQYFEMAAKLALQAGDDNRYFFYLLKIWENFNQNYEMAEQLFITALKNDKPHLAIPFLEYGISQTNKAAMLNPLKASAEKIIEFKSELKGMNSDLEVFNQIASEYLKFGNATAGKIYIDKILAIDPKSSVAKLLKSKWLEIQKNN